MERFILFSMIMFFWSAAIFAVPDRTHTFVLTPTISYYHFDHHLYLKDQTMPALSLEYGLNRRVSAELFLIDLSSKNEVNQSVNGIFCTLDGMYHFRSHRTFQPYLLAGIGVTYLHPHKALETASQMHLDVGVGLKYFVSDRIALRTEVRDVYTTLNGKQDLVFAFGVGIQISSFRTSR
jgi:OOP family OmpA-OmpF porin